MSGFLASSSWCELLTGIYQTRPQQSGSELKAHFHSGAEEEKIATAESQLNARLPISLRSLLLETNGVTEMMSLDGGDWHVSMELLWNIDEIVEQNLWY